MNATNMNCAECRDNLVACLERLLDNEQARQCQAHLASCEACRAEYAALSRLQERLAARGRVAAEVSLVEPVMRAVRQQQIRSERTTLMSLFFKNRWGFGLGAAATAAAVILIIALAAPKAQAKAADVLARGARAVANLTSVHLRGQLRTLPNDNFSFILDGGAFFPIELWKQFEPELKWRVEKPGRVAVMDGQQTILYFKPPGNEAYKLAGRSTSAFDTDWLHRIANLSNTISNELRHAQAQGWKLDLTDETGADGKPKSVVTVHAKSGLPDDDYGKNSFFDTADTRRVYRFDDQTERLEAVQIYLAHGASKPESLLFELNQIDYDQPIDPSVWQLNLPADVSWITDPQKLPDNAKYASMTAEQAARAFFEACAKEDWTEAEKLTSPINEHMKEMYGGLEIVSLGKAFTSQDYPGRFVPYEIKLRMREINLLLSNSNSANRYVITGEYDRKLKLQEDLTWRHAPEVLPNNDAYVTMSPVEVVKAYIAAESKLDWTEMKKFAPDYDVDNEKAELEMSQKRGKDVHKLIPVTEVGEASWSAEHSAYFVKCRRGGPKQWNLALRKDNPVGRWQEDGGL